MKKIVAVIFVLFIGCGNLLAQAGKFSLGFETGPALVSLRGSKYLKEDRAVYVRLNAGVPLYYQISQRLLVKSGVFYQGKGRSNKIETTNEWGDFIGTVKTKTIFDYLTIPVKVGYATKGEVQFYADAGINAGFLLSATEVSPEYNATTSKQSITKDCRQVGLCFSASIGTLVYAKENLKLSFLIQEDLGLSGVYDASFSGNPKTNSTALLVGLVYNLGAKAKQ